MRAKEFINEAKKNPKPSKRQDQSTTGLNKFRDDGGYDRTYELNRVMMATACSDGKTPLKLKNAESWAGKYNTAHPYTEIEQKMLNQAYKALGSEAFDLNNGDVKSKELDSTHKSSPVQAFKGWGK